MPIRAEWPATAHAQRRRANRREISNVLARSCVSHSGTAIRLPCLTVNLPKAVAWYARGETLTEVTEHLAALLQIQHPGEKFPRTRWPAEFQPNGALVGLDGEIKTKKPAALPLGFDHACYRAQHTRFGIETNAIATWQVDPLCGLAYEPAKQIFTACFERGRS